MKAKLKFKKAKFKIGDKVTKEVPEFLQDIYPKFPLGIVTQVKCYGNGYIYFVTGENTSMFNTWSDEKELKPYVLPKAESWNYIKKNINDNTLKNFSAGETEIIKNLLIESFRAGMNYHVDRKNKGE
nr:MAG TPA: hypothetical protein [Caudoviricetes sp.]